MWWKFVLQDVSLGLVFGIGIGLLASFVLPRGRGPARGAHARIRRRCSRSAWPPPPTASRRSSRTATRFIGVFTCAITLGIRRPDIRASFEQHAEDIIEVVKLVIFVVFGALLTFDGLFADGWAAVGIVIVTLLVARPVAVFAALARTGLDTRDEGLHGLVRTQGRRDDDLLAARAQQADPQRRADLQPRGARGLRVDPRPRADRHAGRELDRPAHRGARARFAAAARASRHRPRRPDAARPASGDRAHGGGGHGRHDHDHRQRRAQPDRRGGGEPAPRRARRSPGCGPWRTSR